MPSPPGLPRPDRSALVRPWAVVYAAAWLLGSGCTPDGAEAGPEPGPKPAVVETLRIEPELLRDLEAFSGQLDAEYSVVIKSETDGIVESIGFDDGQRVEQGDLLFQLRDHEQVARVREAEANLALAQEVHGRTRNLLSKDAASIAQRDQAVAELAVARARLELARVELERTRIVAPFDGLVSARLVSPGARVNDETPLVQVDAVDRLQLLFSLSEHAVAFARTGVKVEAEVGPYPGERFPGEVFYMSPTLDPATRRVIFKAWVPNPDGRLRPGLFARVYVEIAQRENALLVPESAIVFDRQGSYVWRVSDEDVVERVPIETGLRKAGRVEVTLGLRPGDVIVTAGTHKVSEGGRIRASLPAATGQALTPRDPSLAGEGT